MDICVDNANRAIFNAANSNPQYAGMGTTLVVGVFRESRLLLGHVGDSRATACVPGALSQITRDHSLLQEQIDAGLITAEQAASSTNKNLVTRASASRTRCCWKSTCTKGEPGDIYLMCSDGLSDMVDDAGIAQLLQTHDSIESAGPACWWTPPMRQADGTISRSFWSARPLVPGARAVRGGRSSAGKHLAAGAGVSGARERLH